MNKKNKVKITYHLFIGFNKMFMSSRILLSNVFKYIFKIQVSFYCKIRFI